MPHNIRMLSKIRTDEENILPPISQRKGKPNKEKKPVDFRFFTKCIIIILKKLIILDHCCQERQEPEPLKRGGGGLSSFIDQPGLKRRWSSDLDLHRRTNHLPITQFGFYE